MKTHRYTVNVNWGDTDPAWVTIKGAHPLENPPFQTGSFASIKGAYPLENSPFHAESPF